MDHAQLEHDVLAALNAVRSNPAAYTESLVTYRAYYHEKLVTVPGRDVDYETVEGVPPVNEAITYLTAQAAMAPLEAAPILAAAALEHTAEQSATGRTGHFGADGSTPGDRATRHGGGPWVAEVIAYGANDAADVIRQLIIDDGVADRGHRTMLLTGHLRYAGVSCAPHPEFQTMCVIDMADTPDGRQGGPLRRVRMASNDRSNR